MMSQWAWVIAGYAVGYGSLAAYVAVLVAKAAKVRRQRERLR